MGENSDKVHHSDLGIDEIRENPPGRDEHHLDREYVVFVNEGADVLDISRWTVENDAGATFAFPEDTELKPGEEITLHSGGGEDTDTDVHWGSDRPVWRNSGDTVVVRDAEGVVRLRESYS